VRYEQTHRWGAKRDYFHRLEAPARALAGGIRVAGLGALLGLSDPLFDTLCLYRHAIHLRRRFWKAGIALSFPRLRPEPGGYHAEFPVDEEFLARIIFAFRICLPDVPLVLSTRESRRFRDGMAGVGISKMSVASLTTVGGYGQETVASGGQFEVNDHRGVDSFCAALQAKGLQPVFKNWDEAYR
jgi:2-iminoacetate synthase